MIAPPINNPHRHPLDVRFQSENESVKIGKLLLQPIAAGLVEAGGVLQDVHHGKLTTWAGFYRVAIDGRMWRFRLRPYGSWRSIWRISVRGDSFLEEQKFTFLDSEATTEFGRGLAAMLRSQASKEKPAWPMFDHWGSFPHYAWSVPCRERYLQFEDWSSQRNQAAEKRSLAGKQA